MINAGVQGYGPAEIVRFFETVAAGFEPDLVLVTTFVVLTLPNTGMITTTDLADSLSDIHPPFKWEIGRRLALLALVNGYDLRKLEAEGPVFEKMSVKGQTALLHFTHTGGGLISKDGRPLTGFTIAGPDGVFVPAMARIDRKGVVVSAANVPEPVAVRFGWDEAAQPNLYNKAGLPARPFRTDNPLIGQLTGSHPTSQTTAKAAKL